MRAVLWDMDGTLVDSEKLWDISLAALYTELGGADDSGGSRIDGGQLGREHHPDHLHRPGVWSWIPVAMAESVRWLHDYTAELFDGGLPWCDGAQELLEALAAEGTPMALVTNTQRALTERALNSIGRHYFSATVCGDEVLMANPRRMPTSGQPRCWGCRRTACLAVEDSVTGTAAAERAGCPVLVVPNDVAVPDGPRRRHISSLAEVDVADLRRVHAELIRSWENAPPDAGRR